MITRNGISKPDTQILLRASQNRLFQMGQMNLNTENIPVPGRGFRYSTITILNLLTFTTSQEDFDSNFFIIIDDLKQNLKIKH